MANANNTFGTWTNGNASMTARYFEAGLVYLSTGGNSRIMTNSEWDTMRATMVKFGYVKTA